MEVQRLTLWVTCHLRLIPWTGLAKLFPGKREEMNPLGLPDYPCDQEDDGDQDSQGGSHWTLKEIRRRRDCLSVTQIDSLGTGSFPLLVFCGRNSLNSREQNELPLKRRVSWWTRRHEVWILEEGIFYLHQTSRSKTPSSSVWAPSSSDPPGSVGQSRQTPRSIHSIRCLSLPSKEIS